MPSGQASGFFDSSAENVYEDVLGVQWLFLLAASIQPRTNILLFLGLTTPVLPRLRPETPETLPLTLTILQTGVQEEGCGLTDAVIYSVMVTGAPFTIAPYFNCLLPRNGPNLILTQTATCHPT